MQANSELDFFELLGRRFYFGPAETFKDWMLQKSLKPRPVCIANVHTLVSGLWDRELGRAQEEASASLADGRPLSIAGKILGAWEAEQLRGPDLMLALANEGRDAGKRHYYFGGAEGVAKAVAANLKKMAPGLDVAGFESPPFRDLSDPELSALIRRLRQKKADFLWLGLGAPKQEKLMARLAAMDAPCAMIGVGAGFDYYAGSKPEAPKWMQFLALEWVFRLGHEPARLWRRYLGTNPLFLLLLISEYFGLYPASSQSFVERLLRLACLPPFFAALGESRPLASLLAFLMPAWLGRLFFLAGRPR
jgi:N-acetylglucosaminyldiphosphoundecaprenol N-acetyl-beta-D-mannosaminyltransferase